jgi:hypothetical protein
MSSNRKAIGTVRAAEAAVASTAPVTPRPAETKTTPRTRRINAPINCTDASAFTRRSPCSTPCATLAGTETTRYGASSRAERKSRWRKTLKIGVRTTAAMRPAA